jgi:uncharacterized protein (TIGR00369 family)
MSTTEQQPNQTFVGVLPEYADEQLGDRMGLTIVSAAPDKVIGTIPVAGNRQPYGLLHGGANGVLAETLGSICAVLNAGTDRVALGLELTCTHHRAARSGLVTGVCTPIHVGRSTSSFDIRITDEDGKLTCSAKLTCVIRDTTPGS